jgi:pilus assembly protein Flp/PilA
MNNLLFKLSFKLRDLVGHEEGQELIQYAMICAVLAFGVIAGMTRMAKGLDAAFDNISSNLGSSIT